jgi:hypothetical protein
VNKLIVQNWVFCEQAREEIGGKFTLLGAASPHLFTDKIPAQLITTLWISGEPSGIGPFEADIRVQDPKGNTIGSGNLRGDFASRLVTAMILGPLPLQAQEIGDYAFEWKFGDQWELIAKLRIELKQTTARATPSNEPQLPA